MVQLFLETDLAGSKNTCITYNPDIPLFVIYTEPNVCIQTYKYYMNICLPSDISSSVHCSSVHNTLIVEYANIYQQ